MVARGICDCRAGICPWHRMVGYFRTESDIGLNAIAQWVDSL